MISLLKQLGGTWDQAKGYLESDLEHIQFAVNRLIGAVFGVEDGKVVLSADAVQGDSTVVPRYVANTGTDKAPKWDLVDVASTGITGRLPYSHQPPLTASHLLGRESGSTGDAEPISVDAGLQIVGTSLSAVVTPAVVMARVMLHV